LVIDISENIEVYKKYIPKSRREGWFAFVKDERKTPAYKFCMEKHKEWYKETYKSIITQVPVRRTIPVAFIYIFLLLMQIVLLLYIKKEEIYRNFKIAL